MNAGRLYLRYLEISWRTQLQYRASFVLQTLGSGLISVVEFLAIWALFDRFGRIAGWQLAEVAVFYGIVNMAWSITEAFARGFDQFAPLIKSGDLDRCLLRPRSIVLQVLGRECTLRRIGRFAQAALVLGWGWHHQAIGFDVTRLLLASAAILSTGFLFAGLLVMQATLSFWTVESLEVMNALTYGGVQTVQYPLAIYPGWLKRFFIFVVPLGCVSYFPVVQILGRSDPLGAPAWVGWFSPVIGVVFLGAGLAFWRLGLRYYKSTGS